MVTWIFRRLKWSVKGLTLSLNVVAVPIPIIDFNFIPHTTQEATFPALQFCVRTSQGGRKQSNIGAARSLSGKYFSLPLLPATPSSLSQTLNLPRVLLLELQRYKDTVRCAALGQRKLSKITIANLELPRAHKSIKRPSPLTRFTITIENSNMSKYSTAVAKKEREGKENNACL